MKKIIAIVMVLAVMICCVACGGLDMSKVKGDWTLSTINGIGIEEYAANLGLDTYLAVVNVTVTDTEYKTASALGAATLPIVVKADGFEVLVEEGGDVMMSVAYDAEKDTLSYKVMAADNSELTYVLVRGTNSLEAPAAEDTADTAEAA